MKPIIVIYWSDFGGADDDFATSIAIDGSGYVYLADYTNGSFEGLQQKGVTDAFLAKLDSAGTTLIWRKQLGGSGLDIAQSVSIDSSGNVYLGGYTYGSFEGMQNTGGNDAFVAKFTPVGALGYSTLLGGNGNEKAEAIAVDSFGNAYINAVYQYHHLSPQ